MQSDLFDQPLLEGLAQAREVISASEERALIACIDAMELSPFRFHGWFGKRLTASYGWRYHFDTGSFGPADPIPIGCCRSVEEGRGVCHTRSG